MESIRDGRLYDELLKLMQNPGIDYELKRINRERLDAAHKKPRVKKIIVEKKIKEIDIKTLKKNILILFNAKNNLWTDEKKVFDAAFPAVRRFFDK